MCVYSCVPRKPTRLGDVASGHMSALERERDGEAARSAASIADGRPLDATVELHPVQHLRGERGR